MIITGNYIKKLRTEKGFSQTELARLVNISQAHIAKIENEKVDPRLSTVNKILLVLSESGKITKCGDIMTRDLILVRQNTPVKRIISMMRGHGISQMPVMEGGKQIGSIREKTLVDNLDKNLNTLTAKDIMDKAFPIVDAEDSVEMLPTLLDFHPAVVVSENGKIRGIISKSDLLGMK